MSNKKSGLGKFIAGATIGVGMGLLFAPKKGSETREELNLLEQEWIIEYDAVDSDNYYNITYGGEGGDTRCQLSKEERRKHYAL